MYSTSLEMYLIPEINSISPLPECTLFLKSKALLRKVWKTLFFIVPSKVVGLSISTCIQRGLGHSTRHDHLAQSSARICVLKTWKLSHLAKDNEFSTSRGSPMRSLIGSERSEAKHFQGQICYPQLEKTARTDTWPSHYHAHAPHGLPLQNISSLPPENHMGSVFVLNPISSLS